MNWVLIVVIVILGFFGWYGAKKGFVKVLFSLLSTVAALLFAILFSPIMSKYLKSNEEFSGFFEERIGAFFDTAEEGNESIDGNEPNKVIDVGEILSNLPIPETMKDSMEKDMEKELTLPTRADVKEYVSKRLSDTIINAIAFVATLAVAIVVLFVVCRVLNLLAKLPLLRQVNAACGLLSGFAEGILIVWILFVVLTMFAGEAFGQSALAMIAENPFLDYLYKSNLIARFVMRK